MFSTHSSTGAKTPDEILIMDTPDIKTATKVWRWNKAGLGYSSNGYNGPYGLAMTQDGVVVADFVKVGVLQSINEVTRFFLDSGMLFIALENAGMMLNSTGISFHRNSDSAVVGMMTVDDDGKCYIKADVEKLSDFYADYIAIQKNDMTEMEIGISNALIPMIRTRTDLLIPSGIKTFNHIEIADSNDKQLGYFGYTTAGGSGLWTNLIVMEDSNGTERGKWSITGNASTLTANYLTAQKVTTNFMEFNGGTVYKTTITDKDGERIQVLGCR